MKSTSPGIPPINSAKGNGSFVITSWNGLQTFNTWDADVDATGMKCFPDHPSSDSPNQPAGDSKQIDPDDSSPQSQYPFDYDEIIEYEDDESNESSTISEKTRSDGFNTEDESEYTNSSFDDYASNESDDCAESASNDELSACKTQVANEKHRKWLLQLAAEAKIRKENELASRKIATERACRVKEILVKKARARRDVSYRSKTVVARANEINLATQEPIITAEERSMTEQARIVRISKMRINAKKKYRAYLDAVQEKAKVQAEAKKIEEKNAQEKRRRIKVKALTNLQSQHDRLRKQCSEFEVGGAPRADRQKSAKPEECESKQKIDNYEPTASKNSNILQEKELRQAKIRALTEKCKAELKEIQRRKLVKENETEKHARRLDRRAGILRKKYISSEGQKQQNNEEENDSKDNAYSSSSQKSQRSQQTTTDMNSSAQSTAGTSNKQPLSVPKKLTEDEVLALAKRLCGVKNKKVLLGFGAKNHEDWKRNRGISKDQKVFSMSGWYPSIRDDLHQRGWIENEDRESPYFDLKWTLSSREVKYEKLKPWQKINHYQKSSCLTTKTGLLHCIRDNLSFSTDADGSTFFPRAYDLSKAHDLQGFLDDFRTLEAENCLKTLLSASQNKAEIFINPGVLYILLTVLRRKCRALDGTFLDYPIEPNIRRVSDTESEVILNCTQWLYQRITAFESNIPTAIDHFLRPKAQTPKDEKERRNQVRETRKLIKARNNIAETMQYVRQLTVSDVTDINNVLESLKTSSNEHQKSLDGISCKNLWIVKPAEKSRGRGIASFRSLQKILDYVEADKIGKLSQWCVQKYMENPLLISNRKFDIRQWVLVSSFDPLVIWFYDDCYARFAVEEYSTPETIHNSDERTDTWLDDPYRHLVNNSISKNSNNFHKSFIAENGRTIVDHMWPICELKKWLIHQSGTDLWTDNILPRIKDIVTDTLIAAQGDVVHRNNSWELFGYDIMLDDKYSPWLIEINSSPACDYSTIVTKNFISRALPDILKVILDDDSDSPDNKKTVIGGWIKIYEGQMACNGAAASNGTDISITGQKLNRPRITIREPNRKCRSKKKVADSDDKKTRIAELQKNRRSNQSTTSQLTFDDSDLSDYEIDQETNTNNDVSAKNGKENNALVRRNKIAGPPAKNYPKACTQRQRKVLMQMPVKTVAWDVDVTS